MLIADTGFWLALANRNDKHHRIATTRLSKLQEGLITNCFSLLFPCGTQTTEDFIIFEHLRSRKSVFAVCESEFQKDFAQLVHNQAGTNNWHGQMFSKVVKNKACSSLEKQAE